MAESRNPLGDMMKTVMDGIKDMMDVTTVVGDAVKAGEETIIIPVSQVSVGFAAGGGEYSSAAKDGSLPFAGGNGAGISVKPVGFLVVHNDDVKMLKVDGSSNLAEKLVDVAPVLAEKLKAAFNKGSRKSSVSEPAEETEG